MMAMPELVSAVALLAMPPLLAYLSVRCLCELVPAWHVDGIRKYRRAEHIRMLTAQQRDMR